MGRIGNLVKPLLIIELIVVGVASRLLPVSTSVILIPFVLYAWYILKNCQYTSYKSLTIQSVTSKKHSELERCVNTIEHLNRSDFYLALIVGDGPTNWSCFVHFFSCCEHYYLEVVRWYAWVALVCCLVAAWYWCIAVQLHDDGSYQEARKLVH